MIITGNKYRNIYAQAEVNWSKVLSSVDASSGEYKFSFSGESGNDLIFKIQDQKIYTRDNSLVDGFTPNSTLAFNGNVTTNSLDLYSNSNPLYLGLPRQGSGDVLGFFIESTNSTADLESLSILGEQPQFYLDSLLWFNTGSLVPITIYNSGSKNLEFYSGETINSQFVASGLTNLVVPPLSTNYFYLVNTGENSADLAVVNMNLYSNIGTELAQVSMSGSGTSGSYYALNFISEFGIINDGGTVDFSLDVGNDQTSNLELTLVYQSGITGDVYEDVAVTDYVSATNVSGIITGDGFITNQITGAITGANYYTSDSLWTGVWGSGVAAGEYAYGQWLPYMDEENTFCKRVRDEIIGFAGQGASRTAWLPDPSRMFSTYDTATTGYAVNDDFWLKDIDFRAVNVHQTGGPNGNMTSLVTPWHIVMAVHYKFATGDGIYFYDSGSDTTHKRNIVAIQSTGSGWGGDVTVGLLDAALPDTIKPFELMPLDWADYVPVNAATSQNSRITRAPFITMSHYNWQASYPYPSSKPNRYYYLCEYQSDSQGFVGNRITYTPFRHEPANFPTLNGDDPTYTITQGGDSGGPSFFILFGKPIMVASMYSSNSTLMYTPNRDDAYGGFKCDNDYIQILIDGLQPTGIGNENDQQVKRADFSSLRKFETILTSGTATGIATAYKVSDDKAVTGTYSVIATGFGSVDFVSSVGATGQADGIVHSGYITTAGGTLTGISDVTGSGIILGQLGTGIIISGVSTISQAYTGALTATFTSDEYETVDLLSPLIYVTGAQSSGIDLMGYAFATGARRTGQLQGDFGQYDYDPGVYVFTKEFDGAATGETLLYTGFDPMTQEFNPVLTSGYLNLDISQTITAIGCEVDLDFELTGTGIPAQIFEVGGTGAIIYPISVSRLSPSETGEWKWESSEFVLNSGSTSYYPLMPTGGRTRISRLGSTSSGSGRFNNVFQVPGFEGTEFAGGTEFYGWKESISSNTYPNELHGEVNAMVYASGDYGLFDTSDTGIIGFSVTGRPSDVFDGYQFYFTAADTGVMLTANFYQTDFVTGRTYEASGLLFGGEGVHFWPVTLQSKQLLSGELDTVDGLVSGSFYSGTGVDVSSFTVTANDWNKVYLRVTGGHEKTLVHSGSGAFWWQREDGTKIGSENYGVTDLQLEAGEYEVETYSQPLEPTLASGLIGFSHSLYSGCEQDAVLIFKIDRMAGNEWANYSISGQVLLEFAGPNYPNATIESINDGVLWDWELAGGQNEIYAGLDIRQNTKFQTSYSGTLTLSIDEDSVQWSDTLINLQSVDISGDAVSWFTITDDDKIDCCGGDVCSPTISADIDFLRPNSGVGEDFRVNPETIRANPFLNPDGSRQSEIGQPYTPDGNPTVPARPNEGGANTDSEEGPINYGGGGSPGGGGGGGGGGGDRVTELSCCEEISTLNQDITFDAYVSCNQTFGYTVDAGSIKAKYACPDTLVSARFTVLGKGKSLGWMGGRQTESRFDSLEGLKLTPSSSLNIVASVAGSAKVPIGAGTKDCSLAAAGSTAFKTVTVPLCPCCDAYGLEEIGPTETCAEGRTLLGQGQFSCPEGKRTCYKCESDIVCETWMQCYPSCDWTETPKACCAGEGGYPCQTPMCDLNCIDCGDCGTGAAECGCISEEIESLIDEITGDSEKITVQNLLSSLDSFFEGDEDLIEKAFDGATFLGMYVKGLVHFSPQARINLLDYFDFLIDNKNSTDLENASFLNVQLRMRQQEAMLYRG
jgi:hypothetical protein